MWGEPDGVVDCQRIDRPARPGMMIDDGVQIVSCRLVDCRVVCEYVQNGVHTVCKVAFPVFVLVFPGLRKEESKH